MISKVFFVACFVVVAFARPDKLPAQGYQYTPPTPVYSPPQPSYAPPAPEPERTYAAPAQPQPTYLAPAAPKKTYISPKEEEPAIPMPFEYAYAVKDDESGSEFSHNTDSDGENTKGEYRVALPDGRTQIVTYTVTKDGGYVAEVTYEGEAKPYVPPETSSEEGYNYQLPEQPEPQPTYQVPQRTYGANF